MCKCNTTDTEKFTTSDYVTALKIIGEYCIDHSSIEPCIDFRGWLLQRINETMYPRT